MEMMPARAGQARHTSVDDPEVVVGSHKNGEEFFLTTFGELVGRSTTMPPATSTTTTTTSTTTPRQFSNRFLENFFLLLLVFVSQFVRLDAALTQLWQHP